MSPLQFLLLASGLGLLVLGGELLVRGASAVARRFAISPLVIGLTVVAFGTSSPELAVGIGSALSGRADLAVGNVVGSNIFNILVILGLSALVVPLRVDRAMVRREVPTMIGASVVVVLLALDGKFSRIDGFFLFAGIILYTTLQIRWARRAPLMEENDGALRLTPLGAGGRIVAGLVALTLGSDLLIRSATAIARGLGISELLIGLTIVAAGTSLPEAATSLIAAFRGERDLAIGNVVGSNIFNLGAVLGASALVAPGGVPVSAAVLRFDLPVMVAVAVACLPIFFTGARIDRWEGALFLAFYGFYTLLLVLAALGHQLLPRLQLALGVFVIPLTLLTLGVFVWRERAREVPASAESLD